MHQDASLSGPGTWMATLDELHPHDPNYIHGQSLASLRSWLGGNDTGTIRGPYGPNVELSLLPWLGRDPQTTYLSLSFSFIPDTPLACIAPDDSNYPPPPPPTRDRFIVCHDQASQHRIELRPVSLRQPPTTAGDLRHLPEMSTQATVCPLCDAIIHLQSPLAETIQDLADDFEGDATPIDVCIYHPSTIPETKTPSTEPLIRATRTWSS